MLDINLEGCKLGLVPNVSDLSKDMLHGEGQVAALTNVRRWSHRDNLVSASRDFAAAQDE